MVEGTGGGGNKVFDFYKTVVDLGTTELRSHRERFYQNAKLNMAIAAAIGIIMFIDIDARYAVFMVSLLIVLGITGCLLWLRQIKEGVAMLARWRTVAAAIEDTLQFRAAIGGLDMRVWSAPEVKSSIERGAEIEEPSGKHHVWIATFWLVYYALVAVMIYLRFLGNAIG